jgi:dephospho-CoA kinase
VLSVALTGNVASGKSAVADVWTRAGVSVVSADVLSRHAVAPGTPGLREVREAFGDGVLAADGTLDRAAVRRRVFEDEDARRRLEAILHPRIRELRAGWLRERAEAGDRLVVAEIPLLYETGLEVEFDVVVLVDAPPRVRLARLTTLRGLSEEEARRVMAAQMDPDAKRRRADVVIDNDGTLAALQARAAEVLRALRARAGEARLRLDLHLHTLGSWDCLSDPLAVVERAAARGVERIAITDHNRLGVALRMADELPGRVIPGEEVKTAEGIDVIGLYLTEEIPRGTPARDTIERVRAQGGIPYLPHPYAAGKGGGGRLAEELAPLVDVVEVFNGRLHPGRLNARAEELARRHGRLRGGGSDAHTLAEVAGVSVEVAAHPNRPDALLRALVDANVRGRTASNLVHLASTWAKVRKTLPGAPRPPGR